MVFRGRQAGIGLLGALLAIAAALHAQAPPAFEAASVKSASANAATRFRGGPGTSDPGQITYSGATLADLVLRAYHLQPYQLKGGPPWLDSDRFEIAAKIPAGTSRDDFRRMLQALLAERFKLAVHRETHDGRKYRLTVDKGGAKLKSPTEGDAHASMTVNGDGELQMAENSLGTPVALGGKGAVAMMGNNGMGAILGNSRPLSELAGTLETFTHAPVEDATGLAGVYDFSLFFSTPSPAAGDAPDADALPGLTQALKEKLGLRLEATRGPIEFLFVDRADRVPTGN